MIGAIYIDCRSMAAGSPQGGHHTDPASLDVNGTNKSHADRTFRDIRTLVSGVGSSDTVTGNVVSGFGRTDTRGAIVERP